MPDTAASSSSTTSSSPKRCSSCSDDPRHHDQENDMTSLQDQTVLVTGANRGMGRHYVTQLLDRGVAKVYAAARDSSQVDASDPRVVALTLDVTDPRSVAAAAETASDVSVLINNAGIV